jgi:hypothetical protein
MADLNPTKWTRDQWNAAGKHVLSAAGGGVAVAVVLHAISPTDASAITDGLNSIAHGLTDVIKGIAGILGVLAPIYAAWRSAHNASPQNQVARATEVIVEASKPGTAPVIDTKAKNEMIDAVSNLPGVVGVVAAPSIAKATPSDRVVADPRKLPSHLDPASGASKAG